MEIVPLIGTLFKLAFTKIKEEMKWYKPLSWNIVGLPYIPAIYMHIHFYGLKYYDYTSHFFKIKWILKNRRNQSKRKKYWDYRLTFNSKVFQCISSQGSQTRHSISHRGCKMSLDCKKDENPRSLWFSEVLWVWTRPLLLFGLGFCG